LPEYRQNVGRRFGYRQRQQAVLAESFFQIPLGQLHELEKLD
jgi:hypothetical protein